MMLKATNLNALLSQNTSTHVTDIFILTPQGTLIAYSSSSSSTPMTLRVHATLAASVWSSYASLVSNGTVSAALPSLEDSSFAEASRTPSEARPQHMSYIALELKDGNLAITPLQCGLLLCLMGPASSQSPAPVRSNGSSPAPQRASLPNGMCFSMPSETASSTSNASSIAKAAQSASPNEKGSKMNQLLKIKAETLVKWLDTELASFKMPGGT